MSISVKNVSKTFGSFQALSDVSLEVPPGKLVALLGPSGSGKTTLLRIIAGLEAPEAGRVFFEKEEVTQLSPAKRRVGFVFQQYALFRHMTVDANIAFGLDVRSRKHRPSSKEIARRVKELLTLVQLDGLGGRRPPQLSGGQRQRVALARALAVEPRVLLLDEPFGALDAKVRRELRKWLREFHEKLHITSLFVTHDQEEALEVADEIVLLNKGKIEQVGSPGWVYNHPSNPFVYAFLGNVNQIEKDGNTTYIRPHDLVISRERTPDSQFEGVVSVIQSAGPVVRIEISLGTQSLHVDVSPREMRAAEYLVGERVFLNLDPNLQSEEKAKIIDFAKGAGR
ncbi:MAG: TOBE-like domain-containing protein [Chthoniobacterales bacterium]